jgi:hypothetical protein
MAKGTQVGMTYGNSGIVTWIFISILGVICAPLGIALHWFDSIWACAILCIAAIFGVGAFFLHKYIQKHRRWLLPQSESFLLEEAHGNYSFRIDQVTDLRTETTPVFVNGTKKRNRRNGSIMISEGDSIRTIDFDYQFPLQQSDPLENLFKPISDQLYWNAKEKLSLGESIEGDGWRLTSEGISVFANKKETFVEMQDLQTINLIDGRVCVWEKSQSQAILSVKGNTRNAMILAQILQDHLQYHPFSNKEVDSGLGRILFERDDSTSKLGWIFFGTTSLLLIIASLFLIITSFPNLLEQIERVLLGSLFLFGGGAVFWGAYGNRKDLFRIHSRGIVLIYPNEIRELHFDQIQSFQYIAAKHYRYGIYEGMKLELKFDPFVETPIKPIHYSALIKNTDEELEKLSDFISEVIASHLFDRYREKGEVDWTPNIRFTTDGLLFSYQQGWIRKQEMDRLVLYKNIVQCRIEDEICYLTVREIEESEMEIAVSEPNFFPGFRVLSAILSKQELKQTDQHKEFRIGFS